MNLPHIYIAYGPGDDAHSLNVDSVLRASGIATRRTNHMQALQQNEAVRHWQTLKSARALVLLWSWHAAESIQVECEWQYAERRRLPIVIVRYDHTPIPQRLNNAVVVDHHPGPDHLQQIVATLNLTLGMTALDTSKFHKPIEAAFIDFICWFFEDVVWDYRPADHLLPLRVGNLPNLPPDTLYRVKLLRNVDETIRNMYRIHSKPFPLLLFSLDEDAYPHNHFLRATVWRNEQGFWDELHWVQCHFCQRWQLVANMDFAPGKFETWCPHCKLS